MNEAPAASGRNGSALPSDALVVFGFTGDLANKKIIPALYAMAKRRTLTVQRRVMGINRIVVTDGKITPRIKFDLVRR